MSGFYGKQIIGDKFYLTLDACEALEYGKNRAITRSSRSNKSKSKSRPVIIVFEQTPFIKSHFEFLEKLLSVTNNEVHTKKLIQKTPSQIRQTLTKISHVVSDPIKHYTLFPDDDRKWVELSKKIKAVLIINESPQQSGSSMCSMS